MVEYAESECHLSQFAVAHHDLGLIAALGRAHAREIHAVAGAPVVFAQIAQVAGKHCKVGAPVFETYEHSHADFVDPGLAHAVEAVDAPVENGLHAFGVIGLVVGGIVCLLEAYHSVETAFNQTCVAFGLHWHHFDGEIVEIGTRHIQHLFKIVYAVEGREFTGYDKQVFKRT